METVAKRFPRTKYLRQLHRMRLEMRQWVYFYRTKAENVGDPWLGQKLEEHAAECDELWHELDQASRSLEWWQTPKARSK